jgi:hypothetical protein
MPPLIIDEEGLAAGLDLLEASIAAVLEREGGAVPRKIA